MHPISLALSLGLTLSVESTAAVLSVVSAGSLTSSNNFQEEGNPYLFLQEVRNCAGRDVSFTIWSAKVSSKALIYIPAC